MRKNLKRASTVLAVSLAAAAAAVGVRPERASQPTDSSHAIQAQPGMSSALANVLNRSCADCHSNTISSHWFTRVPPFSGVMTRTAREGRIAVNFSIWTSYAPEQQRAVLLASCSDATLGTMPMATYLRFRSDAKLSNQDVETICSAAREAGATPATSAAPQSRREP